MISSRARTLAGVLAAIVWLAGHAVSLTHFPPMHADEAWLASETRAILTAGSAAATADFFHLTPRSPHAIRLLFHALQAPFVAASWSLTSVRLVSLAAGLGAVLLALGLARQVFRSAAARLLFVGGLALDPQLFVSSHLARPEILVAVALLGAVLIGRRRPLPGFWPEVLAGSVLGLAIGLHANSLLAALGVGGLYTVDLLAGPDRRAALRRLLVLVGVVALWALLWVAWSRALSPDFPRAYAEFGRRYGVGDSLAVKLLRLPAFYGRLLRGIAGTYFLPDLRLPLWLFAAATAAAVVLLVARALRPHATDRPRVAEPLAVLAGVNLGLVAIGKLSQPSAVLLAPGGYWLAAAVLDRLAQARRPAFRIGRTRDRPPAGSVPRQRPAVGTRPLAVAALVTAGLIVAALGISTARQAMPWMSVSYRRYLERIRAHVPQHARVLGGPNTAFAFAPGALHAFNDLAALTDAGPSFEQYVDEHGIQFILYPDELDRIYAERPIWNDLYGNVAPYYGQMQRFLSERCELVARYEEPVFGMRIVAYQGRYPARLRIYRVLAPGP